MLFLFTMFGAYRLTQFSDQLMTPEFLVTPDSADYSPEIAFDQIQKHPEKVTDGFFNAGFTQYGSKTMCRATTILMQKGFSTILITGFL